MSNNKRKLKLNTVAVSLGCSCRRPKLSSIFNYTSQKNKYHKTTPNPKTHRYSSYSLTPTTINSSSTFSPSDESEVKSLKAVQGFGRIGGSSLAVEKESDDPYLDFRQSMLQMIVEKEMYSQEDLRELLNCFLQLNDSYYHGVIVGAFTEIWNGVYSVPAGRGGNGNGNGSGGNARRARQARDS